MPARRPSRPGGARWRRLVKIVVQRDFGRCWICGHYGGKSADHLVPCSTDESKFWDLKNLKCAHSYPAGCVECTWAAKQLGADPRPVYCNEIRQDDPVEKGRKRIEARTGLKLGQQTRPEEGRQWLIWIDGSWLQVFRRYQFHRVIEPHRVHVGEAGHHLVAAEDVC